MGKVPISLKAEGIIRGFDKPEEAVEFARWQYANSYSRKNASQQTINYHRQVWEHVKMLVKIKYHKDATERTDNK